MDETRFALAASRRPTRPFPRRRAASLIAAALATAWLGAAPAAAAESEPAVGEVTHVDLQTGTVTIRHAAIPTLTSAPGPGTHAFVVRDPVMLNAVGVGRTIRFTAEESGGALVLSTLLPAR